MKNLGKLVFVAFMSVSALFATKIEVLHWWTSGGEAEAASALKKSLEAKGYTWKDFAVAGGGGSSAMTVLKSRAVAGNPPSAAQIKGPAIAQWASLGVLANLNKTATKNNWDKILPAKFASGVKYKGHYVAVPVNVHRVNWMWVNPAVFKKAKAKIPTTWKEFEVAAKKIKKAGFIPVAMGGQDWQEATLFETIVLGVGGVDFYNKVFVKLDTKAINSPTMIKCLETLKMVKSYTDKNAPGRDWNLATAMVYKGKAAMQFMGDWAKGEFSAAKKVPGKDYEALPAPQTAGKFIYNIDSFAFFKQKDKATTKGQEVLANLILSPEFQVLFNQKKGSAPVVKGVEESNFDIITKASMKDIAQAEKNNALVPSMAHQMSVTDAFRGAFLDVITNFYNSPKMSAKAAAKKLAQTIQNEK